MALSTPLRSLRVARLSTLAALALVAAILAMVSYLSARHYARGDLTGHQRYRLSDKTIATLRSLDATREGGAATPIVVTLFSTPGGLGGGGLAQVQGEVKELLERIARYCHRLRWETVDLDRDPARVELLTKQLKFTPGNLSELREGLVVFASGGRTKLVTVAELVDYDFGPGGQSERTVKAFKGEQAFLSALLAVTQTQRFTLCFTTGHDEARPDGVEDDGYSYLAEDLKRDNYLVKTVTTETLGSDGGCSAVLVVGPQRAFSQAESDQLDRYVQGGGKLLLLLGPVLSRGLTEFQHVGLEALAAHWGAELRDALVVDPRQTVQFLTWATTLYGDHPITRGIKELPTSWPAAREVRAKPRAGLESVALVTSSDEGWGETSLAAVRGEAELRMDPSVDTKGPVAVAVASRAVGPVGRPARSRVVVLGSSAFGANRRFPRGMVVRDYNRDLFLSAVAWLTEQSTLVAIGPKSLEHVKLLLTEQQLATILALVMGVMPLGSLALGLAVWWRRRS